MSEIELEQKHDLDFGEFGDVVEGMQAVGSKEYKASVRLKVVSNAEAKADDYRVEALTSLKHAKAQKELIESSGATATSGNGVLWQRHCDKLPRTALGYGMRDGEEYLRKGQFKIVTTGTQLDYRSDRTSSAVECTADIIEDKDIAAFAELCSIQLVYVRNIEELSNPRPQSTESLMETKEADLARAKAKFFNKALLFAAHMNNELQSQLDHMTRTMGGLARSQDPSVSEPAKAFQSAKAKLDAKAPKN